MKKIKLLRKLLASKKRWTRKEYARDKQGRPCDPSSPRAASWCLRGACFKVGISLPYSLFNFDIVAFNDNPKTTHEEVLRVIDKRTSQLATE